MRRTLFCLALLGSGLAATAPAHAVDIDIGVRVPGVSIYIGQRDRDGRYWDGRDWRDERWWHENCSRYKDNKDFRGSCPAPATPPQRFCPPGQAKKGNC
jgi:hypothetical protein